MVKCESLQINMFRITHTGKISKFSRNRSLLQYCYIHSPWLTEQDIIMTP